MRKKQPGWIGIIEAGEGCLVGGVKHHQSIKFMREEHAKSWLATIVATNQEAGRDIKRAEIVFFP